MGIDRSTAKTKTFMNTNTTTIQTTDQTTGSRGGEPDDPGSSADSDLPPEPAPVDARSDLNRAQPAIDVIAPESDNQEVLDTVWVRDRLREAICLIDRPVTRITVSIIDDTEMSRLNKRHCGVDSSTDVLTFPMSDAQAPIEADIAVGVDVARRVAGELGHRVEHELLLYALHGVLHCAGFDDHSEKDYLTMHAEEDRILRAVGIGAVFEGRSDRSC